MDTSIQRQWTVECKMTKKFNTEHVTCLQGSLKDPFSLLEPKDVFIANDR